MLEVMSTQPKTPGTYRLAEIDPGDRVRIEGRRVAVANIFVDHGRWRLAADDGAQIEGTRDTTVEVVL